MISTVLLLLTFHFVDPKPAHTSVLLAQANTIRFLQTDTIKMVNPPLKGFYSKYLDADGIPIRSADVVSDKALFVASEKIKRMLYYMPTTKKNLVKNGAELHIIGKDQLTSDLPEFKEQKGKSYMDNGVLTNIDERTPGNGWDLCFLWRREFA